MICHARWRPRGCSLAPTHSPTLSLALGLAKGGTKAKGSAIKAKTSDELTGKRRPAEDVYTKHYGNEINMADTRCCTGLKKPALLPSLRASHEFLQHGRREKGLMIVFEAQKAHDREE